MTKLDAYEAALRSIANLNNGPDLASGDYRCREAAAIAQDALNRNVGDETFTRIILRAPHDGPIPGREWWYHNFREKGGLTADPLQANYCQEIGHYVYFMESMAAKEYPSYEWQRCRLNVDVQPFSEPVLRAMNATIDEQLRRSARAKLTELELRALGLNGEKES
jgi:hypothetical protein